jgi:hypothetical protein
MANLGLKLWRNGESRSRHVEENRAMRRTVKGKPIMNGLLHYVDKCFDDHLYEFKKLGWGNAICIEII